MNLDGPITETFAAEIAEANPVKLIPEPLTVPPPVPLPVMPVIPALAGMVVPAIGAVLGWLFRNRVAAAVTGGVLGFSVGKIIPPRVRQPGEPPGTSETIDAAIQLGFVLAGLWALQQVGVFGVARRSFGGRSRRRRRRRY